MATDFSSRIPNRLEQQLGGEPPAFPARRLYCAVIVGRFARHDAVAADDRDADLPLPQYSVDFGDQQVRADDQSVRPRSFQKLLCCGTAVTGDRPALLHQVHIQLLELLVGERIGVELLLRSLIKKIYGY